MNDDQVAQHSTDAEPRILVCASMQGVGLEDEEIALTRPSSSLGAPYECVSQLQLHVYNRTDAPNTRPGVVSKLVLWT
jgi:hypothetical protein